MKRIIRKMLERLGYVMLRADTWHGIQQRLAGSEAARTGLAGQAGEVQTQGASLHGELDGCRHQLATCASERHSLSVRIGRAQARVQALKRRRDRLQTELTVCREQVARADAAGRIRELEEENQRLWQRLADLEVYLKETRASSRPYYL